MTAIGIRTLIAWCVAVVGCVSGCDPSSKHLQRCFSVFLERDFFMVEDLFQLDDRSFDEQRFRLGEDDLHRLCSNFKQMKMCYIELFDTCHTYPYHAHMLRVVDTLRALDRLLCSRGYDALQEMILNGRCLERVRSRHFLCNELVAHKYPRILTQMLAFKVGQSVCHSLPNFKQCVIDDLDRSCEKFAVQTWNATIDTIIQGFCLRAPAFGLGTWTKWFAWADMSLEFSSSSAPPVLHVACTCFLCIVIICTVIFV